ncbi:dienelactone hydrolase family protein [Klebsiella oxytoca]|uniref:dienelactone hydrolase family protein n=1 Tax=Klebsiella oxytoca TaxID=571 RepID=UPI00157B1681|nr:dienelactone hydrolase family protein [Klebsiella oxytoca]
MTTSLHTNTPSSKAIILLHEIYGINNHINRTCAQWKKIGFEVYTPKLYPHSNAFDYSQQETAYQHFMTMSGFNSAKIENLMYELKKKHKTLLVVGYSVGATLAWLAARSGYCDGVICYYGSRIRDYCDIAPPCPTLVLIARHEKSFNTIAMKQQLQILPNVYCTLFDASHGFCDADSPSFDPIMADKVSEKINWFIENMC